MPQREGANPLFRQTSICKSRRAPRLPVVALLGIALGSGVAFCQEGGPPPQNGPAESGGPPPMDGRRPPTMEHGFRLGPHGRWWNNPEFAQKLGLTADQQKRMEAVFEQARPGLMDLSGNVRKEETSMEPLLAADQPDESKVLAQIDRVAQARAELEKANARMLLGLRRVLTPEQWKTLQADEPMGHHPRFGPRDPGSSP
jgi:Spy/CpxP family protein refolding chaperone